jgi:hypothetical protein
MKAMKLLTKIVNYFKTKFMKKPEVPIYTLNRAARRRLEKVVAKVYARNMLSQNQSRKERRALARVKAKAHVKHEAELQRKAIIKGVFPLKARIVRKLNEWTGKIHIWRIKQQIKQREAIAALKPAAPAAAT